MSDSSGKRPEPILFIVSGMLYFSIIVLAVLKMAAFDPAAGAEPRSMAGILAAKGTAFRIGIVIDLVMYSSVAALSVALFLLFESGDRLAAAFAGAWRFAEAVLGVAVVIIGGILPLAAAGIGGVEAPLLAAVLSGAQGLGMNALLFIMGLGGTLFLFLFLKTGYAPKALAVWGIATYLSMAAYSIAALLIPDMDESVMAAVFAPGTLFEIVFGIYLFFKGIRLSRTA